MKLFCSSTGFEQIVSNKPFVFFLALLLQFFVASAIANVCVMYRYLLNLPNI